MKKRIFCLSAILFLLCSICLPAAAQDGTYDYAEDPYNDGIYLKNYRGSGGEIVIPSEYDGKKVTGVGYLGGGQSITKVTVPEGIRTIAGTFQDMTALKEVVLPHSLRQVGGGCFQNTGLTSLAIPEGVEEVVIDSITRNAKLKSLSIPASCTVIHVAAIWGNPALQTISIDPQNPNWTMIANGTLLMRKDSHEVFSCAGAAVPRVLTVPEEVTTIRSDALIGCPNLEVLILPKSIDGLGGDVILDCPKMKTIYAKADSFYLEAYAFSRIKGQVTVYCNASPDMEPSENFTVKPYIEGMEKEALTVPTSANGGQTATGSKNAAAKSKTAQTTAASVTETTAVETTTELPTQAETTSAVYEVRTDTEQTSAEKSGSVGWIIGGTVGGVLVAAGAVTLIVLKKKGKLPLKKAD